MYVFLNRKFQFSQVDSAMFFRSSLLEHRAN